VDKADLKRQIYQHPEFAGFIAGMNAHFATWRAKWGNVEPQLKWGSTEPQLGPVPLCVSEPCPVWLPAAQRLGLKDLAPGFHPKELIAALSEDLLAHYAGQRLIDPYAVYQHLMDYWAETMQDDAYLIAADGWKAEPYRIVETDKKGKEKDKGWTCDLVPKALVVARYFAGDQAAIDHLAGELEAAGARLSELEEEHGSEDDAFSGFDKINKAGVVDRLKEITGSAKLRLGGFSAELGLGGPDDEIEVLQTWLRLSGEEAALKKRFKEAEAALDAQAYAHYAKLSEVEIKALVVDDKWLAALDAAIHGEMDRISQTLTRRVKELAERYEMPLPQLTERVAELEDKVNRHLQRMGFAL
jgi:type I restriction enzyme M protein